ncbi:hypothetical protein AJ78_03948 [Emergomyces pasteurianus Ep9510]|uniref:Zn(2)-C6 fungal-type domain-containing protein n=1 Tax=Emergomyces pasteurianus Ep9510 TaxID=1447872 RepID=A0A1J9Q6J2_9EURO|nr:hypothetical protein AJ78_03948 [Emergomyces pasteurianus Ep9510]
MFHTFEGFENPDARANEGRSRTRDGQANKRSSTLRACEQCRRRKIRCDGEHPCEACRWYKKADLCHYSDPRPSRRHVEKLSNTLDEYRSVIEKLFPAVVVESLINLSREELLEMIANSPPQAPPSPITAPIEEPTVSPLSPEDENLESLQTMPEESGDSQESEGPDLLARIFDDVNALSLSSKQPSTYLGVSSVMAVMRVVMWIDPDSAGCFSSASNRQSHRLRETSFSSDNRPWASQFNRSSTLPPEPTQIRPNSMQLINAYFTYCQAFIPLIDETAFRGTFLNENRSDRRWMGLLNMVFALGSIAAYAVEDTSHDLYYRRARQYLTFDFLDSAHLETVQTLALMGGFYLHYVSQPNLANFLMGVALRMATTLGLHREFVGNGPANTKHSQTFSVDLRRRVWWSLFCLDTWAHMTLGRPSMGRWGQGITAKLPQYLGDRENALGTLPLAEHSHFCKIATQVGDALAASPLVNFAEMTNLDNQLVEWYNNLPPLLKAHEPCPDMIATTRTIMRWRYQNQRILLHRPVLLSYAMRRIPYVALRAEERSAIEKCRIVANETIRDISSATRLNKMTGWNAVWFIFQAALVPLLGLFIADNTVVDSTGTMDSCRAQVEIVMITLARMQLWSPAAIRTLEVVSRIFEAANRSHGESSSTRPAAPAEPPISTGQGTRPISHAEQASLQNNKNATTPFNGDSGPNMWDYLTWSDSSLWMGFAGDPTIPQEGLAVYGVDEDFLKYQEPNVTAEETYGGYSVPNSINFE